LCKWFYVLEINDANLRPWVRITAAISGAHCLVYDENEAAVLNLDGQVLLNVISDGDISKFPRPVAMSPQGLFVLAVNGGIQLYNLDGILLGSARTSGCAFLVSTCSTADNNFHQPGFWP
jgi:hypothetical protein